MKKVSFRQKVSAFHKVLSGVQSERRVNLLEQLATTSLRADESLIEYYHALLFCSAFPGDKQLYKLAQKELTRISTFLKKRNKTEVFINSGLPYTNYLSSFTHDCFQWLLKHPDCRVQIKEFYEGKELNDALSPVIPALLRSETTSGYSNEELFKRLKIGKSNQLQFLLTEFSKLDEVPALKDYLFDGLNMYCDIKPRNRNFSLSYNRLSVSEISCRETPISFAPDELIRKPLRRPAKPGIKAKKELVRVIKNSMALKDRETDTVTYLDERTLRLYQLENGISVALYSLIPERQLPLESYIGYTFFSNGIPVAYGGAWVFGPMANFGINIFESFRGAESGYILCQLLRVYSQVFNVTYFEIEPFQYGLDNPEGIETGAFWFYYKYGFRPVSKELKMLAHREKSKLKAEKNYRTPKETLMRFTESNISLQLGKRIPLKLADITNKAILMLSRKFKSDSVEAEKFCVEKFMGMTHFRPKSNAENMVLKDIAMWAVIFKVKGKKKLQLMVKMIQAKPKDPYKYQELLNNFFSWN